MLYLSKWKKRGDSFGNGSWDWEYPRKGAR